MRYEIMFKFFKKMFIGLLRISTAVIFDRPSDSNSEGRLKCVTLNNRPCQTRSRLVSINSSETLFYPFTVSVNKCGESCNTIDDPYARVCARNKVKNINVKV